MNNHTTRIKLFAKSILVLSLFLAFSVCANYSVGDNESIILMKDCGTDLSSTENQLELFHPHLFPLSGWNHINNESVSSEFLGVALSPENYEFSESNFRTDTTCGGHQIYHTVLVKKLADWHHQHANGLEIDFSISPIKVESLVSLIIELKIHSTNTVIPNTTELHEAFGGHLDSEALLALDKGNINLSVTLFEQGANDQSSLSLNASNILTLVPSETLDKWLRIEIPITALDFYKEQNYSDTPVFLEDVGQSEFIGIRLNPESENGKVLRHFLNGQLPDNVPKIFKEYQVSLKRVALLTR